MIPSNEDPPAVAAADRDFGGVLLGASTGIARPTSTEEVIDSVARAARDGTTLTIRGTGHSAGGQAVPRNSVVLDTMHLNDALDVDTKAEHITCGGGATLRQVVERTLPLGLLPRPLTNQLDLSVGGILGIGSGVGPASHLFGSLAANALELDVVTGDAQVHRCSPTVEPG